MEVALRRGARHGVMVRGGGVSTGESRVPGGQRMGDRPGGFTSRAAQSVSSSAGLRLRCHVMTWRREKVSDMLCQQWRIRLWRRGAGAPGASELVICIRVDTV